MVNWCVQWAKPALAAAAIFFVFQSLPNATVTAQSDPSFLPRLSSADVQYVGGFRLPRESANGDSFSFGGKPLAFNPAGSSLFVSSYHGRLAEVTIPPLVNSSNVNDMQFASYIQGFSDPTEGHLAEVGEAGLSALVIQNSKIYGTASVYYDAMNAQRVSHYSRSLQLSQPSFSGWSSVWDATHSGYVSGFMSNVPSEWQSKLGGTALTGQCCVPIVSRTSLGPSGFAFDISRTGQSSVAASPLLYYPGDHPTLGSWESSNEWYGMATAMGGMAAIANTRTVLFVGRNGMGAACYGTGTGTQSLAGTSVGDGSMYCYDPTDSSKGTHAYPYRYQIWAYDLNDFAAVKSGAKSPWDLVPYEVWPIDFPTPEAAKKIGGVGYDPQRQLLYVAQIGGDPDGYEYRPVVHVFQLNATRGDGTIATPIAPSTTVSSVTIIPSLPAPQGVGTTVNFQAAALGGAEPQFKFFVSSDDGTTWTLARGWSTQAQFAWTPASPNSKYKVKGWARNGTSTLDQPEAQATIPYPIGTTAPAPGGTAPSTSTITSVLITANKTAPQAAGTAITFSATAAGGVTPYMYKWFVYNGYQWSAVADWSSQSTYTWTPTSANADYKFAVWMRSAGVTQDVQEGSCEMPYPITAGSSTPPPTTTPPVVTAPVRVSSVLLSANLSSPRTVGSTIAWSATASNSSGGAMLYKWSVFDGSVWTVAANWSSSSVFNWTPTKANNAYQVSVGVKMATNTADQAEATDAKPFAINAVSAPAPLKSVTLSTNRVAPQPTNTPVTWTATVSGGSAPASYKFFVYQGNRLLTSSDWSSSNSFTWQASEKGNYKITVWAKTASNAADEAEASTSDNFRIS